MSYNPNERGAYGQRGYGQGGYNQQGNPYQTAPAQFSSGGPRQYEQHGQQQQQYGQQYGQHQQQQQYGQQFGRQQSSPRNPFEGARQGTPPSYDYAPNDVEMASVRPSGNSDSSSSTNILDQTRQVNQGADEIEQLLSKLENAQRRALNDTRTDRGSPAVQEVDSLNASIMSQYRNLLDRMKRIKSTPGAGNDVNQRHVYAADRKLQSSRQRFLRLENEYQKRMREQTERQYRTAFPNATEEEVRVACEDPNQQVFAQAMMNRDRRGEARQVLGAVRDRHEAIQKIERQMIELAELFNDMERMVLEQEPMVQQVEASAIETHDNIQKANVELTGANKSARAARKKKWICFWICVLLLIIIVAIVIVVIEVNKK